MFRILCIFAIWIGWSSYHPIRGKSVAPSIISMTDTIKRTDNMTKMKPLAQVLEKFKDVHGDRYIYTEINETNYHGSKSIVPVICKEHGKFPIAVGNHLRGQGCPTCANIQRRKSNTGNVRKRPKLVYGVGVNDYKGNTKYNHVHIPSYHTWGQMLKRCYSKEFLDRQPTYRECSVCEEWWSFSNFKKWFDENYIEGYSLDKDILFKHNKLYSPKTCCFVPNEINVLLCKSDKKRGEMPIGVHERKLVNGSSYMAYLNKNGSRVNLGKFYSVEDAFKAYKQAKEAHIKDMATQYYNDGKITRRVYDALMKYEVEITD